MGGEGEGSEGLGIWVGEGGGRGVYTGVEG